MVRGMLKVVEALEAMPALRCVQMAKNVETYANMMFAPDLNTSGLAHLRCIDHGALQRCLAFWICTHACCTCCAHDLDLCTMTTTLIVCRVMCE